MTPKEKAKDLLSKYLIYFPIFRYDADYSMEYDYDEDKAKQCALIAVDELIRNSFPGVIKCHWQEVKQEIEKL